MHGLQKIKNKKQLFISFAVMSLDAGDRLFLRSSSIQVLVAGGDGIDIKDKLSEGARGLSPCLAETRNLNSDLSFFSGQVRDFRSAAGGFGSHPGN